MITKDQALEALRHVVDDRGPEFTYQSTGGQRLYTEDGEGSCGVGRALLHLGVPFPVVHALDYQCRWNKDTPLDPTVDHPDLRAPANAMCMDLGDIEVSDGAHAVFERFQARQDQGATYLRALQSAILRHAEYQGE